MKEAKESILNKAYDLLKTAVPVLNALPRSHKFTFGDRVQNHLSDLLEGLIRTFYAPPNRKKELLQDLNVHLEILRHYIRLGFDLNLFNAKQYHDFSHRIDEIGRMAGGWLKKLQ